MHISKIYLKITFADPLGSRVQGAREEVPAAGADRGGGHVPLPDSRLRGMVLRQPRRQRLQVRALRQGKLPQMQSKDGYKLLTGCLIKNHCTESTTRFCYKLSQEFHWPIGHTTAAVQPGKEQNVQGTSKKK